MWWPSDLVCETALVWTHHWTLNQRLDAVSEVRLGHAQVTSIRNRLSHTLHIFLPDEAVLKVLRTSIR